MSDTASGFWAFTRRWLRRLAPLEPVPTGLPPRLPRLGGPAGLAAVLFDVYGTLLVSASGDIEARELASDAATLALAELGLDEDPARVLELLKEEIRGRHAASGLPCPEVDICEVWASLLPRLRRRGDAAVPDVRRLAFAFEAACNPVWPMPALRETIGALSEAGLALGLVSNAQFYTEPVLAHFIGFPWPFEPELTVTSYRVGRAKPDPELFALAARGLEGRGLAPERALFVGNDMRNDVLAAAAAGFRTALFAGDRRSLRLRGEDPERADCVLTRLDQVLAVALSP